MTVAAQIIRQAFILAHVFNPQEEPEGYQIAQGLIYLNDILSQWGSQGIYIPYFSQLSIAMIPNQYIYTVNQVIAQLLEANTTFPNNTKSFIKIADDYDFNGFDYSVGVGRPSYVYLSKEQVFPDPSSSNLGSKLYVWPQPNTNYTLNLLLKYNLNQVKLVEELLEFPSYYFKPLKYQLALDISALNNTSLNQAFLDEYNRLMNDLKNTIPIDMAIKNDNPFYESRNYKNRNYVLG